MARHVRERALYGHWLVLGLAMMALFALLAFHRFTEQDVPPLASVAGAEFRSDVVRWSQTLANVGLVAVTAAAMLTMVLESVRLLIQGAGVAIHVRQRRHTSAWPLESPVSVIVPAYNESAGIVATVRTLVASTHPQVEVIVVDDGSTDDTAEIVTDLDLPGVRLIRQENAGKAAALNTGIRHATHGLLVMIDGDTVFEPETISRLVQPFADPQVGAVSGNTKVGNRHNTLAWLQHIEYVIGFNLARRFYAVAACMITVPGAVGAFRKQVVLDVGGLATDTLAEDTDLTIAVTRAGWKVAYESSAVAWTEVPASIQQLWRQRYRWTYGTLQAMWKHRRAMVEAGAGGKLGRRGMVLTAIFGYVLPLTAPAVDILFLYTLIFSGPGEILVSTTVTIGLQTLTAIVALRSDKESLRPLWVLPLQVIGYRQLMYLNTFHSVVTALVGNRLRWQRMDRTGTAAAASGLVIAPSTHLARIGGRGPHATATARCRPGSRRGARQLRAAGRAPATGTPR